MRLLFYQIYTYWILDFILRRAACRSCEVWYWGVFKSIVHCLVLFKRLLCILNFLFDFFSTFIMVFDTFRDLNFIWKLLCFLLFNDFDHLFFFPLCFAKLFSLQLDKVFHLLTLLFSFDLFLLLLFLDDFFWLYLQRFGCFFFLFDDFLRCLLFYSYRLRVILMRLFFNDWLRFFFLDWPLFDSLFWFFMFVGCGCFFLYFLLRLFLRQRNLFLGLLLIPTSWLWLIVRIFSCRFIRNWFWNKSIHSKLRIFWCWNSRSLWNGHFGDISFRL